MRLKDKAIVIAGGARGVGKAAALAFAREGANVTISSRDEAAGERTLAEIRKENGNGIFVKVDPGNPEDIAKLFAESEREYGKTDGLFVYAGVTSISPLDSCDAETFDEIMNVNVRGAFFCCQQAVRLMKPHGGSIVLTGSAHAWGGQRDRAAYAVSKGALLTLMDHIAKNYAAEHIRCNFLVPGWTPTEGELALRHSLGETEAELRERAAGILPMGRMLENEDYIEALIYLMSDASAMMTGSVFRITGGEFI